MTPVAFIALRGQRRQAESASARTEWATSTAEGGSEPVLILDRASLSASRTRFTTASCEYLSTRLVTSGWLSTSLTAGMALNLEFAAFTMWRL